VTFFTETNCGGSSWSGGHGFTLGEGEQNIYNVNDPLLVNSYNVEGNCGDVEIFDDSGIGACDDDNAWWTGQTGCTNILDFGIVNDVGGVAVYRGGGGRVAHCG